MLCCIACYMFHHYATHRQFFFCKFYYWEVGKGERPKLFSNFSLEKCYRETLNKKKRCDNNDLIWIILPGTVSSSFSNGAWEKKLPADWDESDTIDWLFTVANKLGIPCEYFASFSHLRGNEQKRMEIFKKNSDFQSTIKKKLFSIQEPIFWKWTRKISN